MTRPLAKLDIIATGALLLAAPWLLGYASTLVRNSEPGQATWNGAFTAAVVLAATAVRAFLVRRSGQAAAEAERT